MLQFHEFFKQLIYVAISRNFLKIGSCCNFTKIFKPILLLSFTISYFKFHFFEFLYIWFTFSKLSEVKQTLNNKPWWFQIKTQISFLLLLTNQKKKQLNLKWFRKKNVNQKSLMISSIFRQKRNSKNNEIKRRYYTSQ